MRILNKMTLLFLLYFILICTNIAQCNLDSTATADSVSRNIVFGPDSIYVQNPNPILAQIGYKPITNDTIAIEHSFDSLSIAGSQGSFHVLKAGSNKIIIRLSKTTKQNVLPITFYNQGDMLGVKKIQIKIAGSYGDWVSLSLFIILIIGVSAIFRKRIFKKLSEIYKSNKGKYRELFSDGQISAEESSSFSADSIEKVNKNFADLFQTLKNNHKKIISEIDNIKLSQEQISKYEIKIADKDGQFKKLESDLADAQKENKFLEGDYKKVEKSHLDQVNALNESIKTITQEKSDLQEQNKKLETDVQLYRSRQSEMSASSLQITSVDKKKMERYKESCKSIIKTINDAPGIILRQFFENSKIINLLNQVFLDQYMGNFEDLLKIRDDIENILLYQRTDNSMVRDTFPGALTIGFEEFDQKYRDLIFDNCVSGKVDKMLIGFNTIYGIKYQIEMSAEDLSQYDKMCDRIKSLENELILNLKLGGFEPYSISLFEELNVQKASYIENIGGLSLKEMFPYYEKKPDQRDLILQITQWAYKKDGGLWKNRKALVKIST